MVEGVHVSLAVEGDLDEAVLQRILDFVGLSYNSSAFGKHGKEHLYRRLQNYNRAALYMPWVVVVDLDMEYDCAPSLILARLPKPSPGMCLRVAVRAIESWLLADSEALGPFLGVPKTKFPGDPDALENPKRKLIDLVQKFGRKKYVKEDLLPGGSGASVGRGYNARLITFVQQYWRPSVALRYSQSLQRAIAAIKTLTDWKP